MRTTQVLSWMYPAMVALWLAAHLFLNNLLSSRRVPGHSTRCRLDALIPFMPAATIVYLSGFLLANMAYLIAGFSSASPGVAAGYALQFALSFAAYSVYPCRADRREHLVSGDLSSKLLGVFQQVSKPYNSFPSMHVSLCLFSSLWVVRQHSNVLGFLTLAWAATVAASTLLAKQHNVVDVATGTALGSMAYVVSL